ncbi:MAG TPA: amidohydrolase family protein [Dehalococcoidia bacterium]|nr:amidohydrolase family protein [Dehalococcoidia bacterium]
MATAILGGTLIDGTGRSPLRDSVVLIEAGRVQAVGKKGEVQLPQGTEVLDASGKTVMPGIIDTHDHLANHGYDILTRTGLQTVISHTNLLTAKALRETLEAGITTVRDAAGLDRGFKRAVEEGLIPGPRLLLTLGFISPTGGVGDHTTVSGLNIHPNPALPDGVADGPAGVRAKVREMIRSGADAVKTATSGGVSSARHGPKDMEYSREELLALVDEGHAQGKLVMCHALGGPGLEMAVECGVDSIEHGGFLDEFPSAIRTMAQQGIYYVPTFSVYVHHRESPFEYMRQRARPMYEHHVRSLRMALDAGVKVAMGTDAGGWVHGQNMSELQQFVEAGMKPLDAITASTQTAAQCIGLGEDLGTIESGKWADILVVDGDPLQDIALLQQKQRLLLVMKGGEAYVDRLR